MSYLYTIDERFYWGGLYSYNAGELDAPDYASELYVLAENSIEYGALVTNYFVADQDFYSLGFLPAGRYKLHVDGTDWHFGNSMWRGVSSFGVVDSYGY